MNSINDRRSIRKYLDKPIRKEDIQAIVKAAMLAPSAKNRQPWKYIAYISDQKNELLDVMERGLIREQNEHTLLPGSANGLPDAFNTLKIMRTAPVIIIIVNPDGSSLFESVDADERITEICDSLSIGASVENMLLKATEMGIGTLWIANTCFAYNELMNWTEASGQLIGAVALGYANESPLPRPRKKIEEVLEYR